MEICAKHPNVTLNDNGLYHSTTVYSWVKKETTRESYHYFLALANSNLMWWFLKNTGDTLQGDARRMKSNYLEPFPIPEQVSERVDATFKKKVLSIMESKKREEDTSLLEKEVDAMVYKLYNLTWQEASTVEQNTDWMDEEKYNGLKLE